MRHFWIWYTILFLLLLMAFAAGGQTPPQAPSPANVAPAQTSPAPPVPTPTGISDWNRVRELATGDEIVVSRTGRHTMHCEFSGATDAYLFCTHSSYFTGARELRFSRAEVAQIRRNQTQRNRNICIGVAAVAGGILTGARAQGDNTAGTKVFLGVIGGGLMGLISYPVAVVVAQAIPGSLVYRRPRQQQPAHAAASPGTLDPSGSQSRAAAP